MANEPKSWRDSRDSVIGRIAELERCKAHQESNNIGVSRIFNALQENHDALCDVVQFISNFIHIKYPAFNGTLISEHIDKARSTPTQEAQSKPSDHATDRDWETH